MKKILLITFLIGTFTAKSQVVDRYNFIQRTTQTGVTIAWRTASAGIGTLNWGLDAFNLTNTETNATATKKHVFDLTGLEPNTQYFYQTSTSNGSTSAIDYFYTAKTDTTRSLSFLHYGDCGYNNTIQNDIADLMISDSTEFGIVSGDVDQGTGDNYDEVFFGPYTDLVKNTCQYTCIGNHDTYADNAATYIDAFYLPTNNPQQTERYYSFTWGNAKFVCLDSNIPYTIGTDQHNWMLDELKCNDKQWLFVFFHHPPWTNAWSIDYYVPFSPYFQYKGNEDMRTDLVPYFETYNVDFVLNGHSHCYQRGELNGVKYIISGGAGSATIDSHKTSGSPNIDTELYTNQYVRFDVTGDTATYVSIDRNDNVIDSVTTIKPFVNIKPVITQNGNTLTATSASSYVWFLDGIQINGAISQTYIPTQSGTYEVMTTNQNGCTFSSSTYIYDLITDVENKIALENLTIYPNPASQYIQIAGESNNGDKLNFIIFNTLGESLFNEEISTFGTFNHQIDLSNLTAGIYFLSITNGSEKVIKKIIKE